MVEGIKMSFHAAKQQFPVFIYLSMVFKSDSFYFLSNLFILITNQEGGNVSAGLRCADAAAAASD